MLRKALIILLASKGLLSYFALVNVIHIILYNRFLTVSFEFDICFEYYGKYICIYFSKNFVLISNSEGNIHKSE